MKKNYIFNMIAVLLISNLAAQSLCQEQLEANNGVSGFKIGQSIFMSEADCSGFFRSIELNRSDDGPELIAELAIFTGQTFIGTPRYIQTVTIPQGVGLFLINFDSGTGDLSFFEESQYAFILSNPTLQFEASSDIDSYVNGQMFIDVGFINNDDLWFKLNTSPTLGVNHQNFQEASLFPNPTNGYIQLIGIDGPEAFNIYNVLGAKVMEGMVSEYEQVSISKLPIGMYFLKLNGTKTLRFVKN